jgi:hypothetical protein
MPAKKRLTLPPRLAKDKSFSLARSGAAEFAEKMRQGTRVMNLNPFITLRSLRTLREEYFLNLFLI